MKTAKFDGQPMLDSRRMAVLSRRATALLVLSMLALFAPIAIDIVATRTAAREQREQLGESRLLLARSVVSQVAMAIHWWRSGVQAVASLPQMARALSEDDPATATKMLDGVLRNATLAEAVAVMGARGQVFATSPSLSLSSFSAPWYAGLQTEFGPMRVPVVHFGAPVSTADGWPLGEVRGALSLRKLTAQILIRGFGRTGSVSLINGEGAVLASSDPRRVGERLRADWLHANLAARADGVSGRYFAPLVKREEFSALAHVPDYPLAVLVSEAADDAFASVDGVSRAWRWGLLLTTLGTLLLFGLALRALRRYEREVTRFRASESDSHRLFEVSPDPQCVVDAEGVFLRCNPAWKEVLGYAPETLIGLNSIDLDHPDDVEPARAELARIMRDGTQVLNSEERMRHADGSYRVVAWNCVPLLAEHALYCYGRDVTSLRHAEARFATAFAHAASGITLIDLDNRLQETNAALSDILGYTKAELAGRDYRSLVFPADLKADRDLIQSVISGERESYRIEKRFVHRNGSTIWADMSLAAVRNASGAPEFFLVQATDISERKLAERALEQANIELARSNRELERFAYVASHDLQEPLRTITSFLQLLARRYATQIDAEGQEFIDLAVDAAQRLQAMIVGLLDLSRIESHGRPFALVDLDQVLDSVLILLCRQIGERGADVEHEPLPTVLGDGVQLGQVLQNLISNALKFCRAERVRIRISVKRKGNVWEFAVADNGIGIDPKFATRVFQMMARLHTREEYPGTGMGLAITQRIVERHGGRIWVESSPGHGSVFLFTLRADTSSDTETG